MFLAALLSQESLGYGTLAYALLLNRYLLFKDSIETLFWQSWVVMRRRLKCLSCRLYQDLEEPLYPTAAPEALLFHCKYLFLPI